MCQRHRDIYWRRKKDISEICVTSRIILNFDIDTLTRCLYLSIHVIAVMLYLLFVSINQVLFSLWTFGLYVAPIQWYLYIEYLSQLIRYSCSYQDFIGRWLLLSHCHPNKGSAIKLPPNRGFIVVKLQSWLYTYKRKSWIS